MEEQKVVTNEENQVEKKFELPEESNQVDINVTFNLKTNLVILKVGSKQIGFNIQDARDLALTLRQAANMVEKHAN